MWVELNGRPVAKLLPGLKLSLRDELAWAFDAVDEDYVVELETRLRAMDDRERLAFYPLVVVRIACRVCSRTGAYRLARLAAKFGPEIGLRDLLDRFSYDCLWLAEARGKRGVSACGVYLPDVEHPRRPTCRPGLCACVSWPATIDGWPGIETKGCPTCATCTPRLSARPLSRPVPQFPQLALIVHNRRAAGGAIKSSTPEPRQHDNLAPRDA